MNLVPVVMPWVGHPQIDKGRCSVDLSVPIDSSILAGHTGSGLYAGEQLSETVRLFNFTVLAGRDRRSILNRLRRELPVDYRES